MSKITFEYDTETNTVRVVAPEQATPQGPFKVGDYVRLIDPNENDVFSPPEGAVGRVVGVIYDSGVRVKFLNGDYCTYFASRFEKWTPRPGEWVRVNDDAVSAGGFTDARGQVARVVRIQPDGYYCLDLKCSGWNFAHGYLTPVLPPAPDPETPVKVGDRVRVLRGRAGTASVAGKVYRVSAIRHDEMYPVEAEVGYLFTYDEVEVLPPIGTKLDRDGLRSAPVGTLAQDNIGDYWTVGEDGPLISHWFDGISTLVRWTLSDSSESKTFTVVAEVPHA